MASLLGSTVANNYAKNVRANGLGPRTLIVKVYDSNSAITDANLNTIINYLTTSHGSNGSGDSAFVVAGLAGGAAGEAFTSGTSDTVFLALQGTGALTVGDADCGISGVTVSIEAIFDQNYQ